MIKILKVSSQVPILVSIFSFLLLPMTAHAIGDIHLYAMPGQWAQDLPTSWIGNLHVRYFSFDRAFDRDGDKIHTTGVYGFQLIWKLGHVQRLSDQWSLTNVVIGATARVKTRIPGERHISSSGMGDWLTTNYVGWHNKANNLHIGTGFTLLIPVGDYNKGHQINIGENRWKLYLPFLMVQYRLPISDGLFLIELCCNIETRFKNKDTGWDDHDLSEWNFIFTYYPSRETRKLGFFVQPDLQLAINESELHGKGQDDGDFFTFGGSLGVIYALKPHCILNLKYTQELIGRELINGTPAPEVKAVHFMLAYIF